MTKLQFETIYKRKTQSEPAKKNKNDLKYSPNKGKGCQNPSQMVGSLRDLRAVHLTLDFETASSRRIRRKMRVRLLPQSPYRRRSQRLCE